VILQRRSVCMRSATSIIYRYMLAKALTESAKNEYAGSEVLNGIAYDPASGGIYVTGKQWPHIYEIKFPL